MGNMSVVVNYKSQELFTQDTDPDQGYVQFTRSGNRVYIVVDGTPVGFVPDDEFARVGNIIPETNEITKYALRHGYGR